MMPIVPATSAIRISDENAAKNRVDSRAHLYFAKGFVSPFGDFIKCAHLSTPAKINNRLKFY